MNIGIIMAGGSGSRMNVAANIGTAADTGAAAGTSSALPKQFMNLGGKPIIMHTLERFLKSGCFDAIYIGVRSDWVEYTENLLSVDSESSNVDETSRIGDGLCSIHIIPGGDNRNATLINVIDAIEYELGSAINCVDLTNSNPVNNQHEKRDPIIVTHDAVRPFVTTEMIEKSINAAASYGAATVAIPAIDTIAVVSATTNDSSSERIGDSNDNDDTGYVSEIPDRSTLYNIQTPQSFRLSYFREAYSKLTQNQISGLTDVCGIFTAAGMPVHIASGDSSNIKITTPFDLKLAEFLIQNL